MAGYIPNTKEQQLEMLSAAGMSSFGELFADIPQSMLLNRQLDLPPALSEPEVMAHLRELAAKNSNTDDYSCFLGAGAYDHYIPAVIDHLISRQEFATAYTPYQPEISQGTLQAIFEYQTLICELTGMDIGNASMYDGATAFAEAASIACGVKKRNKILMPQTINPMSREVVATYARYKDIEAVNFGYANGQADLDELKSLITEEYAAVLIESPNFFGCLEDIGKAAEIAHSKGALLIVGCDPISLAILKSPGELGADIAVGEGQSLGNPLNFGGPYLGFFAAKEALMRKMPGRIVGQTVDKNGKTGFVLTLQAREQHIRREKATSNICSNQALNALAATIYLSLLGKHGLRDVALQCTRKAHYTYELLTQSCKFEAVFSAPFFQEFTVGYRGDLARLNKKLLDDKIIGGLDAGNLEQAFKGYWILAVTEKRTQKEIEYFVQKAVNYSE